MKLRWLALAGVLGLIGAFAAPGILRAAASAGEAGAGGKAAAGISACSPRQLTMQLGPRVSEKTQQETRVFVVHNGSTQACALDGYPAVTLFTAQGSVLPFRYRDHGDQMLTSAKPHQVVLDAGGNGYFGVNKNECVLQSTATASYAAAFPPNQMIGLQFSLDYCGPHDPAGHVVDISPFEKTVPAVLAG
jgi:hypothetical protein